jgi:small-conductance mechanosensitive channel
MIPLRIIHTIFRRRFRILILSFLAFCCILGLASLPVPAAWGQGSNLTLPELSLEKLNNWLNLQGQIANTDTAVLRLDGRRLFLIAAPKVGADVQTDISPVKQRVKEIEFKLHKFVRSDFDPDTLKVTTDIQNGLPVIYANDQFLLTVTVDDAEIYGVDLQIRAEAVSTLLHEALTQAKRERHPDFLKRQSYIAAIVLLIILGTSYGTSRIQKNIQTRRRELTTEAKTELTEPPASAEPQHPPSTAVTTALKQASKRKKQRLYAFQKELLQIWQICLWMAGGIIILGLFPQTRWLQVFFFTGVQLPLQLAGVGLGLYLAIRLSAVLIDSFFKPLEAGSLLSPEAAPKWLTPDSVQRLSLRISTLSQVLKNVTVIILGVVGVLVVLSVIGVPLGPLVASAGVIGIAMSFAAQSVLKDSINGFLIFLEDQYGVGDFISVNQFSGLVEKMGLRITQLRDIEGGLITIPNGEIRAVKNLSKNWARVDINVPIAYSANLMKAMQLMDAIAWEMTQDAEWKEMILEPPQLMGADDFGDQGVIVKLWIKTQPLKQWRVAREYRRRLKLAFDRAGIPLPLPQQVLWVKSQSIPDWSDPGDNQ